jgi:5-(carboxyamino)imidazole ribonucleotide synthase
MGGVPLIQEGLVAFECEISVIAARGRDGSVATYEPARNVHREGILRSSSVPAGLPRTIVDEARHASITLLEALDYVGVIGVEFFVTKRAGLLVNEFAPRVHNSGHWTEAACVVSQFEQHVRAIAGLPLGDPVRHSDGVMENLIGEDVERVPELLGEANVMLHLYGKTEIRPGRKMGHFTRLFPRA